MTVAVIGYYKINKTQKLVDKLTEVLVDLIEKEGADTFLFGGRSQFDRLCYNVVTELIYKYQHIQRLFANSVYPKVYDDEYKKLLTYYEDTFYPSKDCGGLIDIEQNEVMVDLCDVALVYITSYSKRSKNATAEIVTDYAQKKGKRVINIVQI